MAVRTAYERSGLGARVRSPLGAFQGRSVAFMEILTVPLYIMEGETYIVTGTLFGDSDGSVAYLAIANTPEGDDIVVIQPIDSWSDTTITFTFDPDGTVFTDGPVWVKVVNNDGQMDSMFTQISALTGIVQDGGVQTGGGNHEITDLCGLDNVCVGNFTSYHCGPVFTSINTSLYGYGPTLDFLTNTPGLYLFGEASARQYGFGYRNHIYNGTTPVWCDIDGGAHMAWGGTSTIAAPAGSKVCVAGGGGGGMSGCTDPDGWTDGETARIFLLHPVSIQISSPADGSEHLVGVVVLEGFSFDENGEISSGIAWESSIDGALGTGATISPSLTLGAHTITASITSDFGQYRESSISISVVSSTLDLQAILPMVGHEDGGQRVTLGGEGFSAAMTVEFDGNLATGFVFFTVNIVQCIAPAGTGTVDVIAYLGAQSSMCPDQFTYQTSSSSTPNENISVVSITPNSGTTAGGTPVSIAGSGFTDDCTVYIGGDIPTSIVVVDDTEITCVTPASGSGTGPNDVIVLDVVTEGADVLLGGFTYT